MVAFSIGPYRVALSRICNRRARADADGVVSQRGLRPRNGHAVSMLLAALAERVLRSHQQTAVCARIRHTEAFC